MHWEYCAQELLPYPAKFNETEAIDGDKGKVYGVRDFFDGVFLSYELHLVKPSKEIFSEVLRRTGISADDTLFVDDREENCQAAEVLGINTYQNRYIDDWMTAISD